jgi:hypothetical protein
MTHRIRPIALGIIIVAIIPAAAASKPLPGHTGPDFVSRNDWVLNAADAVVDVVNVDVINVDVVNVEDVGSVTEDEAGTNDCEKDVKVVPSCVKVVTGNVVVNPAPFTGVVSGIGAIVPPLPVVIGVDGIGF